MRGQHGRLLFGICLLAIVLRSATTLLLPNVAHPDETFQYLEQAYRLVTGRGMVPWEYAVGARSWVLAGSIVPALKAGLAVSSDPAVYIAVVSAFMIGLAASGCVAAYVLGARAGGSTAGTLAAWVTAVWCELVYLSPHVLADTLAAVPLIGALATGYKVQCPSFRRMTMTGLLFGLAFIFRVQLAPAIAIALLVIGGRHVAARWIPMAIGVLGPLALLAVTDWLTLGMPFQSVVTYLRVNAGGIAATFGTAPPLAYVGGELGLWGVTGPLILVTALWGMRRLPLCAILVGTILLTFSLIGHKEYRFIYPALPLLFVLCGVGTADMLASMRPKQPTPRAVAIATGIAMIVWLAASTMAGTGAPMWRNWHLESAWLDDFRRINADANACGVGIAPPDAWFLTGLVRLRRDIRLYDGTTVPQAYNYLVAVPPVVPPAAAAFRRLGCDDGREPLCLYKREGGCDPSRGVILKADPGDDVRAILHRLGLGPY